MRSDYKIDSENKWIPDGFHFLGPTASTKRRQLLEKLCDFFSEHGYSEVIPPSFDFTSSFINHLSKSERDSILKARDLQGREISPGIDLTIQVVKGMAGFLQKKQNHNVFYRGTTIKDNYKSNTDRREVMQVGAEVIGSSDAKTFAMMLQQIDGICKQFGLSEKVTLVLGHVRVFSSLAKALYLSRKEKIYLSSLLYAKNYKEIQSFLQNCQGESEVKDLLLQTLLEFDSQVIVAEITKVSKKYQLGLEKVVSGLSEIGVLLTERLHSIDLCVDFSLLRDLDYYTGFVFHGYTDRIPYPIFTGGAYDHLYEKFSGVEKDACGFALNLDLFEEMIEMEI